jgi:predicted TIM-barrel fold metal-dependent hydrolase
MRLGTGPIVDCNVHLWDQGDNPVFWLSDRTLVRDMLGDYDSLPDRYTLSEYRRETAGYDVRGFAGLIGRCQQRPVIRSIRMRLVPELSARAVGGNLLDDRLVRDNLALLASSGLVATVEATSSQLSVVTRMATQFPALRIVIDHFGWPQAGPGGGDLAGHMRGLAPLAAVGNVATRIDAIGTIFGDWTLPQIRPWLLEVTGIFGPQRCMLGSDLPIENLRSGFGRLYAAYDAIFSAFSDDERAMLFHRTAERWYARRDRG